MNTKVMVVLARMTAMAGTWVHVDRYVAVDYRSYYCNAKAEKKCITLYTNVQAVVVTYCDPTLKK